MKNKRVIAKMEDCISGPSSTKKQKIEDDSIQYFETFLRDVKNKNLINVLKAVSSELRLGLVRSSVVFLRVAGANANSFASFCKATVDTEVHEKDSRTVMAPVCLFFIRGHAALEDFLDPEPKIPADLAERQALRDLLQFLTNTNEQSILSRNKDNHKEETEAALAIRLAEHLLIPLVPQKRFVIDSYPCLQDERCCSIEHPKRGRKGDTSFGCPKGWHGRADILLCGDEVPFTVVDSTEDDDISVTSDSSVEVKRSLNFTTDSYSQITAQAIVYSFVQQRKKPTPECALVPGIGICSEKLVVYLYDCVEDILLTTGPIELFAEMGVSCLSLNAIIILWFMLNHRLFSNKTPEKYSSFKADFHNVLGPVKLEAYQKESEQPFKTKIERVVDVSQFFKKVRASCVDDFSEEKNNMFPGRETVKLFQPT